MDKEQFVEKFAEALEMEASDLTMDTEFRKLNNWDSLAYLSIIAMLDEEYEVQIEQAEFKTLVTLEDIYNACIK